MRATLLALLLTSACSKKTSEPPVPTCSQIVDNMLVVMKQGMTGHGGLEMGNREQMVKQCESRKLTPEAKRCMLVAKDLTQLASCSSPPKPTAPAVTPPTGSGS